ncbi:Rap1a/Tai family immunity protein [Pseudoroseomonas sp. WGS1072]|uniref:Rap1a/Tai family immunity protein n=1 Tax=Roseomonas sp. WGS1072 TaxID=3366816 RepID=UPI003BF15C86
MMLCGEASAQQPQSGFYTGNRLLELCRGGQGICHGYIAGVASVMGRNTVSGWAACIPSGSTVGQIRDLVVKALENNPQERHLSAESLVASYLAEAFPCR